MNEIPLKEAMKLIKQNYRMISEQAIRRSLRNNEIPHIRSSDKKRARISIKMEDLQKYISKLLRG